MGKGKQLNAQQVLSAFGAKAKPTTLDTMDKPTTLDTQATMDRQAKQATMDTPTTQANDTNTQYRHIAINNDVWAKVKALQGQTGAPLNQIINRALSFYIGEIEKSHGEITTPKIKLI